MGAHRSQGPACCRSAPLLARPAPGARLPRLSPTVMVPLDWTLHHQPLAPRPCPTFRPLPPSRCSHGCIPPGRFPRCPLRLGALAGRLASRRLRPCHTYSRRPTPLTPADSPRSAAASCFPPHPPPAPCPFVRCFWPPRCLWLLSAAWPLPTSSPPREAQALTARLAATAGAGRRTRSPPCHAPPVGPPGCAPHAVRLPAAAASHSVGPCYRSRVLAPACSLPPSRSGPRPRPVPGRPSGFGHLPVPGLGPCCSCGP